MPSKLRPPRPSVTGGSRDVGGGAAAASDEGSDDEPGEALLSGGDAAQEQDPAFIAQKKALKRQHLAFLKQVCCRRAVVRCHTLAVVVCVGGMWRSVACADVPPSCCCPLVTCG
jgi:hypothetical protein